MTPEQQRKRYQRAKDRIQEEIPEKLYCKKCDRWIEKPEENFPKNPLCTYGLAKTCKECKGKRATENRHANPEKHAAYMRKRRAANPERTLEIDRACKERNRERFQERANARRRANPEHYRQKKWRYNHSAKGMLKNQSYSRNRKAVLKGIEGSYTDQQIQEKLVKQKYRCYYAACGYSKFPKKKNGKYDYHIEHTIPISRTEAKPRNDIDYVVLACEACNYAKWTKLPHEWPEGNRLL